MFHLLSTIITGYKVSGVEAGKPRGADPIEEGIPWNPRPHAGRPLAQLFAAEAARIVDPPPGSESPQGNRDGSIPQWDASPRVSRPGAWDAIVKGLVVLEALQATRGSRPSLEPLNENIRSGAWTFLGQVRQTSALVGPVSLGETAQGPEFRKVGPPKRKKTNRVILGVHL